MFLVTTIIFLALNKATSLKNLDELQSNSDYLTAIFKEFDLPKLIDYSGFCDGEDLLSLRCNASDDNFKFSYNIKMKSKISKLKENIIKKQKLIYKRNVSINYYQNLLIDEIARTIGAADKELESAASKDSLKTQELKGDYLVGLKEKLLRNFELLSKLHHLQYKESTDLFELKVHLFKFRSKVINKKRGKEIRELRKENKRLKSKLLLRS